ncbi:MAG: hypothetical protein PUC58_01300 [Oscillospiraceae bacterium]|nr:hypothetical protein [Oscillospiraceae bacterium]
MKIKEKLQSSKGASLIIALVFMLFCAMVGSAVLAAATANGGRVAALKSDQQDYLNQRSAATLLQDELTISRPQLVITKTTTTTTKYKVGDGGATTQIGNAVKETAFNFEVKCGSPGITTPLQRVLFESAILRYMEQNDMQNYYQTDIISGFKIPQAEGDPLNIKRPWDFIMCDETKATTQDAIANLSVDLRANGESESKSAFTARVGCSGNKDNLYCFLVDFGNETTEGMLSLRMYATVSDPHTIKVAEQGADDNDSSILVKSDIETVTQTISWDSPEVMKGTVKLEQSETKGAA